MELRTHAIIAYGWFEAFARLHCRRLFRYRDARRTILLDETFRLDSCMNMVMTKLDNSRAPKY